MTLSPMALARGVVRAYGRNVGPIKTVLSDRLLGHPRPLVFKTRSLEQYRVAAEAIAARNSRWLGKSWFREDQPPANPHVRGYCFVCGQTTSFAVDTSVCSTWQGRPVPWWTNTLYCSSCRLVARMRAALQLFEECLLPGPNDEIYITEQTTALYQQFLKRHPRLVGSEYLVDSTPRGSTNAAGIRCEDLTSLTFSTGQFDFLLSFEVFEHIPDYKAALRECARVLKTGGQLFCSVPFHGTERHTVRARLLPDGSIEHLLPAEYHGDPVNSEGVLCFRYFGMELLDDLKEAGFTDASAWLYWSSRLGYLGEDRVVFVAIR